MDNPPTLLISDGVRSEALALGRRAREAGLVVITDSSARVVELARRHRPGLILLDVQQQSGHGLELLAQLRQSPGTRGARVVATATKADEFAQDTALDLGALEFAIKPFDEAFLQRILLLARPPPPAKNEASAGPAARLALEVL